MISAGSFAPTRLTLATTILLTTAIACSSDNNDRPDAGGPNNTPPGEVPAGFEPETLASRLAEAECAYYQRCIPAALPYFGWDLARCHIELALNREPTYEMLLPTLRAGRMTFDLAVFNQCVDEYATVDCTLGPETTSPCNRFLRGARASGESCFINGECGDNAYCRRPAGPGTCGLCTEAAAQGNDCVSTDGQCQLGQTCAQTGTNTFRCVNDFVAEGNACGTPMTGFCRGGLECVGPETAPTGTCTAPVGQSGQPCDPDNLSAPDCNGRLGLTCIQGTCQMITSYAAPTEACGGTVECREGAFCSTAQNVCVAFPGANEACLGGQNGTCADDHFCNPQDICEPARQRDEPCTATSDCAVGLTCLGNTCRPFSWSQCN
jgi:hypothetical protein